MADPKGEVSVVELVTQGYGFAGAALEVGALVVDGTATAPEAKVRIPLAMVNRHGLVAGATGTGKTKTLQRLAEQLSEHGVPVFLADIKGDLSGMATRVRRATARRPAATEVGQAWAGTAYPVEFYALGGQGTGIPIRVEHHVVRAGAAVQGARAERDPGVLPRPGLPLRRRSRPPAARPQGPACGRRATSSATRARPSSTGWVGCPRRRPA